MKLDVGYISELARLELTEDEKSLFQAQLDNIVGYMDKINSVNVDGVEPMMHGMTLVNVMREDEIQPSMEREEALANAPKRVGDEFLLPKIVEGAES
ncbi:MAG: Asp-tRNA(Asn)/Glu-tRNA(Gln) amidotransferase subunit GatC [Kiritimatiellae bacterium]|nr:Asp-tRNA(Asn)/Glu-tRNA(Gln) amidotransferase subunit GatC [Kiritimatiellia bacterium]MBR5457790.1 Asp-tRNA(Asn)/Glu-tRNA(Gln) amidotransferase subunit GatC [Kiritimatiellia bacterium]